MHAKYESLLPGTAIPPAMRFNMRTRSQRGTEHRCFFGQQVEPYQDPCPKSWKTCSIYEKPSGNKKPAWNRAEASIRAAGRSLPFSAAIPQNPWKRSQNLVNSMQIIEIYKHIREFIKICETLCKSMQIDEVTHTREIHEKIGTEHPRNQASKHAKFESCLSGTTIPPAMRFNILSSSHRVLEKSAAETATCK